MKLKDKSVSVSIRKTIGDAMAVFLEDFTSAIAVGDRQAGAIAASKVAQLGLSVFEFFSAGCESVCLTQEDRAACHQASIVVRNLMEKHLDSWYEASSDEVQKRYLSQN